MVLDRDDARDSCLSGGMAADGWVGAASGTAAGFGIADADRSGWSAPGLSWPCPVAGIWVKLWEDPLLNAGSDVMEGMELARLGGGAGGGAASCFLPLAERLGGRPAPLTCMSDTLG
jgi:hypothetical protein